MVAVRLPEDLERRLAELARKTGRTKTFYIHQALLQFMDDQEDAFLSEPALTRIRSIKEDSAKIARRRHGGKNGEP